MPIIINRTHVEQFLLILISFFCLFNYFFFLLILVLKYRIFVFMDGPVFICVSAIESVWMRPLCVDWSIAAIINAYNLSTSTFKLFAHHVAITKITQHPKNKMNYLADDFDWIVHKSRCLFNAIPNYVLVSIWARHVACVFDPIAGVDFDCGASFWALREQGQPYEAQGVNGIVSGF